MIGTIKITREGEDIRITMPEGHETGVMTREHIKLLYTFLGEYLWETSLHRPKEENQ